LELLEASKHFAFAPQMSFGASEQLLYFAAG